MVKLWLRSQDKNQLLKVCSLSLTYEDKNTKIICYDNNDKAWVVGFYKTKERALEVLDEIQEILNNQPLILRNFGDEQSSEKLIESMLNCKSLFLHTNDNIQDVSTVQRNCVVYQIPLE